MTYYYYGNLKDATITEGDVSCELQYPITNINILDKNVYSYLNDNDTSGATDNHYIDLVKIDFGSVQSGIIGSVIDLTNLAITLSTSVNNIEEISILIRGSADDITYSTVDFYWADTNASTSYSETLNTIYSETFSAQTYRYWKIVLFVALAGSEALVWDIDGKINNLYIGSYATLPCPALIKRLLLHKTNVNESYSGGRSGYDNQGQRKGYIFPFNGLSETNWTTYEAFDAVCGQGAYPCYVESDIVSTVFARVYEGSTGNQLAYQLYELTNRIEAEL